MPKIEYTPKNFSPANQAIVDTANKIIKEYMADRLKLTLRQLYYQFVARGLIENKASEYKRLGSIISDARLAGHIDWRAIEDRTRNLKDHYHNTDPGDAVKDALDYFKLDRWQGQDYRVEVWIEKEALVGVIAGICEELDVPYFACKGYVSQSEMWAASQRLISHQANCTKPIIIHLGDHDPSGIDMTRDIFDRHELFMEGDGPEVKRIALNMNQAEEFNPPPNPAKITDSRAEGYISKYGGDSWELDALEPRMLRGLIRDTVTQYRDDDIYRIVLAEEEQYKDVLKNVVENWRTL